MEQIRKKEIGSRVEKVRVTILNNISQVKLAKAIGMTGQNIGQIINGKGTFSLDKLIDFCDYAGVSSDYILWGKESALIDIAKVNEALVEYNKRQT